MGRHRRCRTAPIPALRRTAEQEHRQKRRELTKKAEQSKRNKRRPITVSTILFGGDCILP